MKAPALARARKPGAPDESTGPVFPDYPYVAPLVTLLFSGYVIYWYLQVGFRVPALGAIRAELIYAMVLGGIAVSYGPSLASPVTGYLVALLLSMAVQLPFSYAGQLSIDTFTDRVLKFFCMALFIVAFVKGPRQLRWFLGAFLLACLKMGQEGFLGHITGSLEWENQGVLRLHGTTPIYEHPNSFAGMALGTIPFCFYLFPISNRWIRGVLLTLAVFAGTIILYTASRTGYVGVIGFVGFVFLRAQKKTRTLVTLALVVGLTLPFVPMDYMDRFNTIFTGVDKEGESTEKRMEILRDSWEIFKGHPFGVGVAAFPAIRDQMFGRQQDTHNLYFEVATNLGIQGLLIFALFVLSQLRLLSKLLKSFRLQLSQLGWPRAPDDESSERMREHIGDLRLMTQTAIAVQSFLIVRLTLGLFGMDLYEIYWWFAMGLTIALFQMEKVARARTDQLCDVPAKVAGPVRSPIASRLGTGRWMPSETNTEVARTASVRGPVQHARGRIR